MEKMKTKKGDEVNPKQWLVLADLAKMSIEVIFYARSGLHFAAMWREFNPVELLPDAERVAHMGCTYSIPYVQTPPPRILSSSVYQQQATHSGSAYSVGQLSLRKHSSGWNNPAAVQRKKVEALGC